MEIVDTFASRRGITTGVAVDKVPEIPTKFGPYKLWLRNIPAHLLRYFTKKAGAKAMGFPTGVLCLYHTFR
jgi:hypothetical protein